jgi:hypothetical protein
MTEEIIEIVTRVKIAYDETKEGLRQKVVDAAVARNAQGATSINIGSVFAVQENGTYCIQYLPGGLLISPRPVKPPDHMLVMRMRADIEAQRTLNPKVFRNNSYLLEDACEAIANASGQMCDIAEYHMEKYFKLWAQRDKLVEALKATVLLIETDYGGFDAVPEWQKAVATLTEAGVRD